MCDVWCGWCVWVCLGCVKDEKPPLIKSECKNTREAFKVERSKEEKGTKRRKLEVDQETALERPYKPFPALRACVACVCCVRAFVASAVWAAVWQSGLSSCLFTLCFLSISNPAPGEQRGLRPLSQTPLLHLALENEGFDLFLEFVPTTSLPP